MQQHFDIDTDSAPEVADQQQERDQIREQYRLRLAEKLKDSEFRKIEGFPIGTDEAILALSDPPYYTACPNPFIEEWLAANAKPYDPATDNYHREPFAADVSEGKNDPIYNAHSYHTKVPHKAIMRYILHYTEPGDVVYDGFCGTGMTGVAAQMCGDKSQVESLGYKVCADGVILDEEGKPFSKFGARKAILNDLSPAATFIAYNYNMPVDAVAFEREAKRILKEVEEECGWMYSTLHDASPEETERIAEAVRQCRTADELRALDKELRSPKSLLRDPNSKLQVGRINYTVWSDVLVCPNCGAEIIFWDVAVDFTAAKVRDTFACLECRAETSKKQCHRATNTYFDTAINQSQVHPKQEPVILAYKIGKRRFHRRPNVFDRTLAERITKLPVLCWFPCVYLPFMHMTHERTRLDASGITHTHHFYTARNLCTIANFWKRLPRHLKWYATSFISRNATRCNRFIINSHNPNGRINGPLTGTYYVPSEQVEQNVFDLFADKIADVDWSTKGNLISTSGGQSIRLPKDTVDYIFTDPPFGENIYYADLNYLVEAWHQVFTNAQPEAIIDQAKRKELSHYQNIMEKCLSRYYYVLKYGRWMTVEFHNSSNAVWNAIQEGLERVGFIVADVRVLNKQHGGVKAAYMNNTVNKDLVISCYKPRHDFEERFKVMQGKPEGVVEFLREHLSMLPVAPINKAGKLESVAERTRFLLFDRMVAYHLQHGARIPLSAADFYRLLEEQFVERDEMYFLNEQSARYDALKARGVETEQLSIFVRDEKTAVQWVRSRLTEHPQTLGDLTPKFMQELREWDSHEPRPELRDLLKEYFVEESGVWHVPDPNSEKDIENMRRNALLRLFREYTNAKGPLKVFRKEAVLEGFRYCWETQQYNIIVAVCEKIPEKILQEIQDLVMMYDVAKDLAGSQEASQQAAFVWE